MVIGESEEIQTAPVAARLNVALVPSAAVAEVAAAAKLADVVDEGPGIAHGKAAAGEGLQGIFGTALVRILAVVGTEDVGEIVFRMGDRTQAVEVLTVLQDDRVPGVLTALSLATVAIPIWPIDGLVIMPEATDVNIAVGGTGIGRDAQREAKDGGEKERGGAECVFCVHIPTVR